MQKNVNEALIVACDFSKDDTGVVVVGRRIPGTDKTDIINAFQGEEARELWSKLTTKKEKNDGQV